MKERQWALVCHLSGLAGYIVPFGNIIAPLVIWSLKKEEFPSIDAHGKEVINFQLSFSIWILISSVLIFFIIGIPLLIVLIILHLALTIIGAVKADSGNLYNYPFTIGFLS